MTLSIDRPRFDDGNGLEAKKERVMDEEEEATFRRVNRRSKPVAKSRLCR
jgi:hypothetical protein